MKGLAGKTYIITGASKGIGKVIALEFLRAGASVVINGRDEDRLESVRLEFEEAGYAPLSVTADLSQPEACDQLLQSAVEHFGKINGLINNAGVPARGKFEKISPSMFDTVLNGNLLTAVNITRAALPELMNTKGSIVFISSIAAIHGLPNAAAYSVSKMGVEKFAESLRIEMHHYGIHVGILRPGLVQPPPDKRVFSEDGSYQAVNHKGHQSQESVAKAAIRMVLRRKGRVTMTPAGKLLSILNWLSPGIVRLIFQKTQNSSRYEVKKDQ